MPRVSGGAEVLRPASGLRSAILGGAGKVWETDFLNRWGNANALPTDLPVIQKRLYVLMRALNFILRYFLFDVNFAGAGARFVRILIFGFDRGFIVDERH